MSLIKTRDLTRGLVSGLVRGSGVVPPPAPTYATWNTADKGASIVLSGGDLAVTNSTGGAWNSVRGTIGKSSGKWQFEVEITGGGSTVAVLIGVGTASASVDSFTGGDAYAFGFYGANGQYLHLGSGTAFGLSYSADDVITCYYDADTGTLGWKINDDDQGTIASGLTGEVFPMISVYASSITTLASFGEVAMQHPKAGYNERWASS